MNLIINRFKKMKNKKGFTLVELIVVIVIIGILAAIMIPRLTGFTNKAEGTQAVVWAKDVATAFDSYYAEKGSYANTSASAVYVENLSGVSSSNFSLESDGGLTVTYTNSGGTHFSAGRSTSSAAIVAN